MKPTKILWPMDFSKNSEKALPYIKKLSQDMDTEIHVLYVIEDTPHHEPWYGEFNQKHIRSFSDRIDQTAKKRLNQICDKYMDGCPLFIRHTAKGEPATEILKLIKNEGIDKVVMTHKEDPNRLNTSHTFETVFANSPVPVKTFRIHSKHQELSLGNDQ